jgi:hypothetical protein
MSEAQRCHCDRDQVRSTGTISPTFHLRASNASLRKVDDDRASRRDCARVATQPAGTIHNQVRSWIGWRDGPLALTESAET